MKILEVGNSFGFDAIAQSGGIFSAAGYDEVLMTAVHYPACDILRYLKFIREDRPAFWIYRKDGDSDWKETYPEHISPAVLEQSWDVITMMPGNYDLYNQEKLLRDMDALHDFLLKKTDGKADFYWIMKPPIVCEVGEEYPEQEEAIFSALLEVSKKAEQKPYIKGIIPTGTAVMNLRTTDMKSRLTRDTLHMSIPLGRYASALTFASAILGVLPSEINYKEDGVSNDDAALIKRAADAAIKDKYHITNL